MIEPKDISLIFDLIAVALFCLMLYCLFRL